MTHTHTTSKKIQSLQSTFGSEALEATKNGYLAIVAQNEDGTFNLSVSREGMPAHWSANYETPAELETEMRSFVNDLRRWTFVTYE